MNTHLFLSKHNKKLSAGFTFLELVAVITITAIIGAFALSRWNGQIINADGAAQQLAAQIRFAQTLSMTHAQHYQINFNTSSNTYTLSSTSGTTIPDPITGYANVTLGTNIQYGSITNLNSTTPLLAFDGIGIPYTDTSTATTLNNAATIPVVSGSTTRYVIIYPTTGLVLVQ